MSSPSRLKRWAHCYRAVALMAFGTLVAILAANALLWVAFKIKDASLHRRPEPGPEHKYASEKLAAVYPDFTADERRALLLETWSRPYVFEDFVHFREGPFAGKYVNVSKAGFRCSKDQGPWPPNPANFNVFVFGGSTTFGYGVADWQTVPSHLQEELAHRWPGRRACVYNFGAGFYYSTQERILFERLLTEGFIPSAAVFIDGINECGKLGEKPVFRERFEKAFAQNPETLSSPEICIQLLQKTPMARAGRMVRKLVSPEIATTGMVTEEKFDEAQAARIVPTYLANKSLVEGVCRRFGISPVFVWQPCPVYKYHLRHHPFVKADLRWPEADIAYPAMRVLDERGELGKDFLWCADIQEDKSEPLYVDMVHYTAKFSAEFAEFICALGIERHLLPEMGR